MSPNVLLLAATVIAVASVPPILEWVPPNPLYGFRTPRMLANEALWYRVNHFASREASGAQSAATASSGGLTRLNSRHRRKS